uniref:DDE Tnp4 domain-containing protein n=1 Tax=Globodera pallida TaxID=36090 RepID=A0A183C5L3_GLOPA
MNKKFDGFTYKTSPLPLPSAGAIIQPMNAFFEQFFATEESLEFSEWERALPTKAERQQMRKLIHFLFRLNDFSTISSDPLFLQRFVPILAKSVQLSFIGDLFCVIHEHFPSVQFRRFARFWGYTVLTAPAHSLRPHLHHSAPHFESDGNVCNQSASLFERTSSRSLVIAGASRFAVCGNVSSSCQPHFMVADGAHNDQTMFHTMCTALFEVDKGEGTFVQWHGMAQTSCEGASAFVSAGASRGHPIYAKPGAALNRLVNTVNGILGENAVTTPDTEPKCRLVASKNIFGRMINGVPIGRECNTAAQTKDVKGKFIHVEQKSELYNDWETWTTALKKVFPIREN